MKNTNKINPIKGLGTKLALRKIELDKIIIKVNEATKENEHNIARMILAKRINNQFLLKGYIKIEELNVLFGYMPQSLLEVRSMELDPILITKLEKEFPNDINRIKKAL